MLVLKTVKPFLQLLFHSYTSSRKCHFYRTRKRGSVLVTIFCYNVPCLQTSLPSIADKATADNPVLRQYTTGGTLVTASHARMTMTVTGLPHGSRKANFPLICSTALNPSTWRCTPIPLFPCRHPGRHQVSFSLLGAKVKTVLLIPTSFLASSLCFLNSSSSVLCFAVIPRKALRTFSTVTNDS